MAATAAQIAELRRMVNELTDTTYSDATLMSYIERYPLVDTDGYESSDDDWTPTYNLYAAAADICMEKAAAAAAKFDFAADGAQFNMSQLERSLRLLAEQYRAQASKQMPRLYT